MPIATIRRCSTPSSARRSARCWGSAARCRSPAATRGPCGRRSGSTPPAGRRRRWCASRCRRRARAIVESKSAKLYFTALNDTRFDSGDDYRATIVRDLSAATAADVRVELIAPDDARRLARAAPAGLCLDTLALPALHAAPDAAQLAVGDVRVAESLVTQRFRSVCPVTGQPDYATLAIAYRGAAIDHAALLAYLVAFRRHPGFHEHCVERIFADVTSACAPDALAVSARFTRRGGIDISPWRRRGDAAILENPTLVQ